MNWTNISFLCFCPARIRQNNMFRRIFQVLLFYFAKMYKIKPYYILILLNFSGIIEISKK